MAEPEVISQATANGAAIITVGLAAITTISGAIGAYFSYRTTRDKMEYDAERVQMKADIKHLTEKFDSCDKDREELAENHKNLELEVADLRRRWDERSATHESLDRRKAEYPNPAYDGPRTRAEDANLPKPEGD